MVVNIVGASSGRPRIIEKNGEKYPVMTSGYSEAKGMPGETWVTSSVFKKIDFQDQVTKIWNIHDRTVLEPWLEREKHRVMIKYPDLGYQYLPWQRMLNKYGPVFGSTVAWMLCHAIEQGSKVINLFGLDMATETEYAEQRDTVYYWIGRAEASGIVVNIPEMSRLYFKDRAYGVIS